MASNCFTAEYCQTASLERLHLSTELEAKFVTVQKEIMYIILQSYHLLTPNRVNSERVGVNGDPIDVIFSKQEAY
jgi:hypothetical protein